MLTVALVLAGLAALVHVYIFWLEALAFDTVGRKAFGVGADDAAAMRPWAFNQGFYNLFLALGAVAGIVTVGLGHRTVGVTLIAFATACMLGAGLVLAGTGGRPLLRAAVLQAGPPVVALIGLAVA